ncbi:MAG: AraC family transcriptional regulator [Bacteroidota bacterium]
MVFSYLLLRIGLIHKNKSSKWLGFLLFLYAMYITPYMLGYANWYEGGWTRETLFFVPFMQVLLIGPVVYFYLQSLLNESFQISNKDWLHLLPAFLYLGYSLVVFVTDKLVLEDYYFYADGKDKDLANWYQATGVVSMSAYLISSLRLYANYKKLLFNKVSFAESLLFKWVRNFMIAFLIILILRVVFFITNPEWGNFGSQFWHYIAFSFVFYYIAVTGYSNAIKQNTLRSEQLKVINIFDSENLNGKNDILNSNNELDISTWKGKLSGAMKDNHLFENPRLTLSDVAEELETTAKTVSTAVNSGFNMNFNDFVNHYRVEAVKNKLENGEQNTSTLLGIALDCGFNSKATFNRAFKKSTSLTPKAYLDEIAKK